MDEVVRAGRYRIEEKIGEGGMGVVFRAHDLHLDCKVALKEIKPEHLNDPQYRARLAQEARAAAAIDHPGIAHSIDFVDDGQEVFVVYEFVGGVTLRQRMSEEALALGAVLDIAIKLADALETAHRQGFLHRDIKPENIMLAPRPEGLVRVKILDFGLAKRLWTLSSGQDPKSTDPTQMVTHSQMIVGTLDYMSPEQLSRQPLDHRSDIFSLGVVLYEMLAGRNPFRGDNIGSTISNIHTMNPPSLSDMRSAESAQLDHVVRKCLCKKREDRYASVHEVVTDLSELRQKLTPEKLRRPAAFRPQLEEEPPTQLPRSAARALFLLTQLGFLVMYGFAYRYLPQHSERLAIFGPAQSAMTLVFFLVMLLGTVVHVYFLSSVGLDYRDSGRLFRQVFVPLLVLDCVWATVPLLLFKELEWISWLCVVGLAFLPFSQKALIYTAYARRGGRSSGVRERILA
jgi:serine/threonine protein kinase